MSTLRNTDYRGKVSLSTARLERPLQKKAIRSSGTTINCVTSEYFPPEAAEHYRRQNIEHMLVTTSIESISSLHELISVYRADLDQPFSEEGRLFQQQLIPHQQTTPEPPTTLFDEFVLCGSKHQRCLATDRAGIYPFAPERVADMARSASTR